MTDEEKKYLREAFEEWKQARKIIADFFLELFPSMANPGEFSDETIAEHNAAAILARLAHANLQVAKYKE